METSWDVLEAFLERLGASWARLGSVLGASGGVFGASWRRPRLFFRFSAALKPYWDRLGAVLEASGSAFEASWRRFGASWRAWARLGRHKAAQHKLTRYGTGSAVLLTCYRTAFIGFRCLV